MAKDFRYKRVRKLVQHGKHYQESLDSTLKKNQHISHVCGWNDKRISLVVVGTERRFTHTNHLTVVGTEKNSN